MAVVLFSACGGRYRGDVSWCHDEVCGDALLILLTILIILTLLILCLAPGNIIFNESDDRAAD